ncbi:SDR family NAD(P)-dependent oxidoreductase [Flammeovirga sp. SJP92]|uniref:SDR family NAD(P)-dependent oxidoreductase n=1 Tax=Flammeovirga sp. SJP92 TaxID=1775430 RepID=UPI000788B09B|nr:SDR family NAD(P)-dependent oxidoreductase [Flammeovirga sp. SJP92]KXX70484.1 short-chain dehydrogenase [Flammeovirga sp. SJP92]
MESKIILITGSTDGIGKIASIELTKMGHQVFVHGRNKVKVNTLIQEIETLTNHKIKGFAADFSNLDEVKKMADEINGTLEHIDVLINNAGVFYGNASKSTNGYDLRFTVNYLAPYILTNELIETIQKSKQPRIINLSSAAQTKLDYNKLEGKIALETNSAYAQSKLALTIWNTSLAKQYQNITSIAVNPGSLLKTKMALDAYGQFWSPAEKGSDLLIELALDEKHKHHNGDYFDNDSGRYTSAHPDAYNKNEIKKLIAFTNKILEKNEIYRTSL